jgi:hypothetical protein
MDPEQRLAQIEEAIGQIADVLQQMCEKLDWHDRQLDDSNTEGLAAQIKSLSGDFGSMIGGFNGILGDRKKARFTDMVKGNAGLQAYAPKYNRTFRSDLVGDAVQSILAYLDQEGASEDGIPDVMNQIISELKARLDDAEAEGDTMAHEASESGAEENAEHGLGGSESGPMGKPKGKAMEIEIKTGGELPPDLAAEARRFRGQKPA